MRHVVSFPTAHTYFGNVSVCVCVPAIVLMPCLQLISHDFIHIYSKQNKKKLFNAFKCKQSAHSHSDTHTHSHIHTDTHSHSHSLTQCFTFILELSSFIAFALGCLFIAFSFLLSHFSLFPSSLVFDFDFFLLPLHICLNDLYIFCYEIYLFSLWICDS